MRVVCVCLSLSGGGASGDSGAGGSGGAGGDGVDGGGKFTVPGRRSPPMEPDDNTCKSVVCLSTTKKNKFLYYSGVVTVL